MTANRERRAVEALRQEWAKLKESLLPVLVTSGLFRGAASVPSMKAFEAALSALDAAQGEALREALEAIEKWTPPMVVSRIDGRTVSMGFEWGSDGERDYFREVARKALDAAQGGTDLIQEEYAAHISGHPFTPEQRLERRRAAQGEAGRSLGLNEAFRQGWIACQNAAADATVSNAAEFGRPILEPEAGPSREALMELYEAVRKSATCDVGDRVDAALFRCDSEFEKRPEPPVEAGPKRVHVAQEHDNAWCPGHAVATSECPAPVEAAPAGDLPGIAAGLTAAVEGNVRPLVEIREELRAELPHAPVGTLFIRQSEDGPVDGAFWHNAQLAGLEDGEYEVFIGAKCAEPPVMKGHTGCLVCSGSGTVIVQGDGPLKVEPCPAGRADAQAAGSEQPLSDGGRGAAPCKPSITPLEPTPRACCDEARAEERRRCKEVVTEWLTGLPDEAKRLIWDYKGEVEALARRMEEGR